MDALNFLFQKPALTWFDFYLEPAKLIPHLSQENPEPGDGQLIVQFCEQAKIEELQATAIDVPPDEVEYHHKKATQLWCLAFQVCAHLKWNLTSLKQKCHLVHMKYLMQSLIKLVLGTSDLAAIFSGYDDVIIDSGPAPPDRLVWAIRVLCARWILHSIRNDAFPMPPPRITVSNPSAQIDPSIPMLEAKAAVIQELKSIADAALEFLQDAVREDSIVGKAYTILKPSCFVIPDETDQINLKSIDAPEFNWEETEALSPQLGLLQCAYDLGEHNFFLRRFKAARESMRTAWNGFQKIDGPIHGHFTLDKRVILGYCDALKIGLEDGKTSAESRYKSPVWKHEEEEKNASQKSLAKYAQLRSRSILESLHQLDGVTERDILFFRTIENATTFCLALKNQLSSRPPGLRSAAIIAYLEFLCSCHPALLDTLKGCGVMERLHRREGSLRRYTSQWPKPKESSPDLTLLAKLEPPWHVLHTFDSVELKANAQRTQPNRVSTHFFVPVPVQPVLLKLPTSIYQDVVALACCKAQQLTQIGDTSPVTALLDLASNEARSGSGETYPELKWELIRLELVRWHNLLHRCSDVQRMGQLTMDLATKVKSFVASCSHKGSQAINAHWELHMLITSFLLNTCDWEYILLCASFHRFANFGKVLASLCYEVQKGGSSVKNVAREFFDIMLPTMMDTIQYKRGTAGMQMPVLREAPAQLLSRSYFTAIVKNLKEPWAVSLLIAFFVKLYNGQKAGMMEIYSEHLALWPATFVDSAGVNEAYLNEIFQITLENALLVNPNNAFWLRARGDFELVNDRLRSALQYYLQCLFACSDGFAKPLPENVIDDKLVLNMVKCCGRLEYHTLEALLCQLLREPNYGLAIKALRESVTYDGVDVYFNMIWDPALSELLIYVLDKSNQQHARLETAMRVYLQQENNFHNDDSVLNAVAARRRKEFLTAGTSGGVESGRQSQTMDQAKSSTVERSKPVDVTPASTADGDTSQSLTKDQPKMSESPAVKSQPSEDDEEDCDPFNLDTYQPISSEILSKLLNQAEFYFSDSNVLKDKFLMKTIQKNKGGFVSVKLLSSFRRMQTISKDWRDLAYSLRRSEKLELNEAGNKVRRKDPLPQWDDSVFDRTVVAINLQIPEVSVNAVKTIFSKYGDVTLVRVLQPGKNLPEDLQQFAPKHPELSTRVCAVVELAKEEQVQKAIKELSGSNDWRGMQVLPLRGDFTSSGNLDAGIKVVRAGTKGKENIAGRTVVTVDSSPSSSPSTRRKKTNSRSSAGASGGIPIPGKQRLDSFGSRGSPSGSPCGRRRSPKPSSYLGSSDDVAHERYDSRTPAKPIPGRMQQHRGTPVGSPDLKSRGPDESPLSCSPTSLGTSPWIRRKALMEQIDPSSSPGKNLITVVRQPRGPDGSKGFVRSRLLD